MTEPIYPPGGISWCPPVAMRIITSHDRCGNPRRGWMLWTVTGKPLTFLEEGYTGSAILRHRGYGDAVGLGEMQVPVSQYNALVKEFAP